MKKENILNFLTDYAYNINAESDDVKQDLKNSTMNLFSKDKGLLYKRLHEIKGIIEAVDNFRTYVKRYHNQKDYDDTLDKAKKYAHEAMSKLETKTINEEVKQAIIDAYIKGIQE